MTPTEARDSLARMLSEYGQTITLQRGFEDTQDGPNTYIVKARIMKAEPSDVVGSVQQVKRMAIVSAQDVDDCAFPIPFIPKKDRVLWQGKQLVISSVDDATRRIQGTLIAYELELSGA